MGSAILKLDRERKHLNTDVTSTHPVDLKSVESIEKHVSKCEQNIIQEHNTTELLKLRHEITYNNISLSQKEPDKRR